MIKASKLTMYATEAGRCELNWNMIAKPLNRILIRKQSEGCNSAKVIFKRTNSLIGFEIPPESFGISVQDYSQSVILSKLNQYGYTYQVLQIGKGAMLVNIEWGEQDD